MFCINEKKLKISLFSPFNNHLSSYGLRLIHNSLKKNGIDSNIFYYPQSFFIEYDDDVIENIYHFLSDADIIGFTLMTNHFNNILKLTKYIKEKNPNIIIIWGGIHPTIEPDECIKYADIVCVGEGEESFPELCKAIEMKKDYTKTKGFWFKKNSNIIKNEPRIVEDLNKIPYALYTNEQFIIYKNNNKYSIKNIMENPIPYFTTLASRGCPNSCTYCINCYLNKIFPRKIRFRTVDNVIKELEIIKKLHGTTLEHIRIDDDSFCVLSNEYIKEFSEKYKKKINLPLYVSGITPKTISEEKLKYLKYAGLEWIRIGFQSGSEKILKMYKRNYKIDDMIKSVDIARNVDLGVQLDIITDNPWENDSDIIDTINLLENLKKPYNLGICNLIFFPGTELREKAINEGIINKTEEEEYGTKKYYLHNLKKTNLNETIKLCSIRAKYGLKLPKIISYMIKKKLYHKKSYSILLSFYKKINEINKLFYLLIVLRKYGIIVTIKKIRWRMHWNIR